MTVVGKQGTCGDTRAGLALHKVGREPWRVQLANAFTGEDGLRRLLGAGVLPAALRDVVARYPFFVTPYYASLGDMTDPVDPIRIQCIPDPRESNPSPDDVPDPFCEVHDALVPGLIQRFRDRVLVIATQGCAVCCRHCTRKNLLRPGAGEPVDWGRFESMARAIETLPSVREVILSGGDPFLLEDESLDRLLERFLAIAHVEVVRIGTRVPVVLPMRVTDGLCSVLRRHRPVWVNTQFNHPAELTGDALQACGRLVDSGVPVSNQSVLLKGVNDDVDTMRILCSGLQRGRIRPYYVFHGDPVLGTGHLRTRVEDDARLAEMLRLSLGGLALPRFVADMRGAGGKVPLESLMEP